MSGAPAWAGDRVMSRPVESATRLLVWPPKKKELPPVPAGALPPAPHPPPRIAPRHGGWAVPVAIGAATLVLIALGFVAPPVFLTHLTVFALACIVGWQVVWNVTPALHTPLMSVTNAISGIIVVGGMLAVSGPTYSPAVLLGAAAILLAAINIAGGFLVTQRMLRMFRR